MTEHIQQPPGSHLCGQACAAMLLGCPLEAAIALFGHRGRTRAVELARVLRRFGYVLPEALQGRRRGEAEIPVEELPATCIVRTPAEGRTWHWALRLDGVWHDPGRPAPGRVGPIQGYLPVRSLRRPVLGPAECLAALGPLFRRK